MNIPLNWNKKISQKNLQPLIILIKKITSIIQLPNTNTRWSEWDTPEEARDYFISALEKLKKGDNAIIAELKIIFSPTGSLQELSISSGWSEEYMLLAAEFDRLVDP